LGRKAPSPEKKRGISEVRLHTRKNIACCSGSATQTHCEASGRKQSHKSCGGRPHVDGCDDRAAHLLRHMHCRSHK